MVCASCLQKDVETRTHRPSRVFQFVFALQYAIGLFFLLFVFYTIGQALLNIPSDFHEGTLWEKKLEY